jgi:hypothetical protein
LATDALDDLADRSQDLVLPFQAVKYEVLLLDVLRDPQLSHKLEKMRGGWFPEQLTQKSPWTHVILSLDLTEKQKRSAIAILEFVAREGKPIPHKALSVHARSSKTWVSQFVSRREMKTFITALARKGVCSYRYAWYLVAWLIRMGWLDGDKDATRTRKTRGYSSDRAIRYAAHLESVGPKLWKK